MEISKWRIHRPNSIPILEMRQVCPPEGKMYSNTQPVGASPRLDFLNHICVFMCFVFGYFFFPILCMHAKLLQSCLLFATLGTVAHQTSLSMGFSRNNTGGSYHALLQLFSLTSPFIRKCNCHVEYVGFMEHKQNAFVFLSTALKTQQRGEIQSVCNSPNINPLLNILSFLFHSP